VDGPWLGVVIVPAALGGLLAALSLFRRLAQPHPELLRKLLHVGMGIVTLSFPWLFESPVPVVVLAAGAVVFLLLLRLVPRLQDGPGQVVAGVGRVSWGDTLFPVAVAIVFYLARNTPVDENRQALLYAIPILLLTLADAGAALVGIRYGTVSYSTEDGSKTLEGSLSFLLVAFFCTHVPILLATDVGRPETLLIALLLAMLTTMSEAVAWRGLDNLFLPILAFFLLEIYLDMSLEKLAIRALVMVGLIAFVLVYRQFTTIAGSGILGAALFGYASWALGGNAWLAAPLAFFVAYSLLSPATPTTSQKVHNAHAVLSIVAAELFWLFLYRELQLECLLAPFVAGFSAHLSLTGVARFRCDQRPVRRSLVVAALQGWIIIALPIALYLRFTPFALATAAASLVGSAVAVVLFDRIQPLAEGRSEYPVDRARWIRQGACGAIGSLAGLAVCWTGYVP
jgi:phytol kinase